MILGQTNMVGKKRKLLAGLLPLIICSGLSLIFELIEPKNFPDPSYPYRTKEYLDYLSKGWLFVGIVLSVVFFFIILIEDLFGYFERVREEKRLAEEMRPKK
jgi:formate-dependent nitrite reductase membrane component NrfD